MSRHRRRRQRKRDRALEDRRRLLEELGAMDRRARDAHGVERDLRAVLPLTCDLAPEIAPLLAGLLCGDGAAIARAAHMTVDRYATRARLEGAAIAAGARIEERP